MNDYSIQGGFKGKSGAWDYDIGHVYGINTIKFNVSNSLNASLPTSPNNPTQFYCGELLFNQNTTNFDVRREFKFNSFITSLNTAFGVEHRVDNYQIQPGELLSYSDGGVAGKLPGAQVFRVINQKIA